VSDPIDIKALDEYLKGGSDISQRYRDLGRDEVPPELDRRVLDEARAAVAGGSAARSRSWLRWSAPVALAASVVLVVAVVLESPIQDDTSLVMQSVDEGRRTAEYNPEEKPAPERQQEPQLQQVAGGASVKPAAPPVVVPQSSRAKAEAKRVEKAAAEEVAVSAQRRDLRQADEALAVQSTPVQVLPADAPEAQFDLQPPPAASVARTASVSVRKEVDGAAQARDSSAEAESLSVQEVAVTGSRVRRAQGRTAGPRNTISSSAFSETRPAADADAERDDPVKWLEEIRDLRRDGKIAQADRAWDEFREAFPDFPVADDDSARSKR
jgi:hypothetical protein